MRTKKNTRYTNSKESDSEAVLAFHQHYSSLRDIYSGELAESFIHTTYN